LNTFYSPEFQQEMTLIGGKGAEYVKGAAKFPESRKGAQDFVIGTKIA